MHSAPASSARGIASRTREVPLPATGSWNAPGMGGAQADVVLTAPQDGVLHAAREFGQSCRPEAAYVMRPARCHQWRWAWVIMPISVRKDVAFAPERRWLSRKVGLLRVWESARRVSSPAAM